jgi:hypothetical protein
MKIKEIAMVLVLTVCTSILQLNGMQRIANACRNLAKPAHVTGVAAVCLVEANVLAVNAVGKADQVKASTNEHEELKKNEPYQPAYLRDGKHDFGAVKSIDSEFADVKLIKDPLVVRSCSMLEKEEKDIIDAYHASQVRCQRMHQVPMAGELYKKELQQEVEHQDTLWQQLRQLLRKNSRGGDALEKREEMYEDLLFRLKLAQNKAPTQILNVDIVAKVEYEPIDVTDRSKFEQFKNNHKKFVRCLKSYLNGTLTNNDDKRFLISHYLNGYDTVLITPILIGDNQWMNVTTIIPDAEVARQNLDSTKSANMKLADLDMDCESNANNPNVHHISFHSKVNVNGSNSTYVPWILFGNRLFNSIHSAIHRPNEAITYFYFGVPQYTFKLNSLEVRTKPQIEVTL